MLREWEKLPKFMQTEEVRLYYDSLEKKKISLALKREFDVFAASVMPVSYTHLYYRCAPTGECH